MQAHMRNGGSSAWQSASQPGELRSAAGLQSPLTTSYKFAMSAHVQLSYGSPNIPPNSIIGWGRSFAGWVPNCSQLEGPGGSIGHDDDGGEGGEGFDPPCGPYGGFPVQIGDCAVFSECLQRHPTQSGVRVAQTLKRCLSRSGAAFTRLASCAVQTCVAVGMQLRHCSRWRDLTHCKHRLLTTNSRVTQLPKAAGSSLLLLRHRVIFRASSPVHSPPRTCTGGGGGGDKGPAGGAGPGWHSQIASEVLRARVHPSTY